MLSRMDFQHCALWCIGYSGHRRPIIGTFLCRPIKRKRIKCPGSWVVEQNPPICSDFLMLPIISLLLPCNFTIHSFLVWRMAYQGAVAFEISLIIDLFFCYALTTATVIFSLIYTNICTNIRACTDDLQLLTAHINEDIRRGRSVRRQLLQFIRLQWDIYRCVRTHGWLRERSHLSSISR